MVYDGLEGFQNQGWNGHALLENEEHQTFPQIRSNLFSKAFFAQFSLFYSLLSHYFPIGKQFQDKIKEQYLRWRLRVVLAVLCSASGCYSALCKSVSLKFKNNYSLLVGAWHGRQGGQEGRRDDNGGEEGGGEAEVIDLE